MVDTPNLGWRSHHDPRSKNFPIRALLPEEGVEDRAQLWNHGAILDQGHEGACVGYSMVGELLAEPEPSSVDSLVAGAYALDVYHAAQKIDDQPGEDYTGTSVLAGIKTLKDRGHITEYRWAFSIEDVRDAIIHEGPVCIGIPWYSEMYSTRPDGLVKMGGDLVGGHAIVLIGYDPAMAFSDGVRKVFIWQNSWGPSYGVEGIGYIQWEDLKSLLANQGEAAIPMGRQPVVIPDETTTS